MIEKIFVISSPYSRINSDEFWADLDRLDFENEWQDRMMRVFTNDQINGFTGTFEEWLCDNKDRVDEIIAQTKSK